MPRPITLSFDLLHTFLLLIENQGDASLTAAQLDINQPSMSKRLRYLQHAGDPLPVPWLERRGKTWHATAEGERVLPAVREIIHRYNQLRDFAERPHAKRMHFACGQADVTGFVRQAVLHYRKRNREAALRVSTLRGEARIEGVASGSLDLACVSHEEADIHEIARRPLYVELLQNDRFVLICAQHSQFAEAVERLSRKRVSAPALARFPLILPEPDASARHLLDEAFRQEGITLEDLDVAIEIGGWGAITSYVKSGLGVGVVGERSVRDDKRLIVRPLDPHQFVPRQAKLICRRRYGSGEELDLTPEAEAFRQALLKAAKIV